MKAKVKCEICEEILSEIEKEKITEEDVRLYKEASSCHEHGQEKLAVEIL